MASGAGGSSSSSSPRNHTVVQQALISRMRDAHDTAHRILTSARTRLEEILYPSWLPQSQSNPKEDQDLNALFQEFNTHMASVRAILIRLESPNITVTVTEELILETEKSLDDFEQDWQVVRADFDSLIEYLKRLDLESARICIRAWLDLNKLN